MPSVGVGMLEELHILIFDLMQLDDMNQEYQRRDGIEEGIVPSLSRNKFMNGRAQPKLLAYGA